MSATTPPPNRYERELLAAVNRWARGEGWQWWDGHFRNANNTVRLDWWSNMRGDHTRLTVDNPSIGGPSWIHSVAEVEVKSIRQAVDVLAALDIIPGRFTAMPPHDGVW